MVRKLIAGILTRGGYAVVEAELGRARELLRDKAEDMVLLVTDAPEFFLDYARQVPLVYLGTFPQVQWAEKFPRCRFLSKPFPPERLLVVTHELLDAA